MRIYISLVFFIILLTTSVKSQHNLAVSALGEYFELLATGNFETAEMMWLESAQERSSRFGITYTDIPLKIDCVSPVVRGLDRLRDRLNPPAQQYDDLPKSNFGKATYSVVVGTEIIEHDYYLSKQNGYYWLSYPQDYYTRDWPIHETRFFMIHVNPNQQSYIHTSQMNRADELLLSLAEKLELSDEVIKEIEEAKIEYYYCATTDDVDSITGHSVAGTVDLASNDIISKEFPHLHELVHLLVNIRLKSLPLYTLPLLREGVAVCYGGRWGKDVGTLLELAAFLHTQKFVELDSILTTNSFKSYGSVDIAYPLTGLFSSFLIDKVGLDNYFSLYLELSGSSSEIATSTRQEVQSKILTAVKISDWSSLLIEFDNYSNDVLTKQTTSRPGKNDGKVISGNKNLFEVRQDDDWVGFTFDISKMSEKTGTLLIKPDSQLFGMKSSLFDEHFKGEIPFPGYRYSVRFDVNEAGLYDYVTNLLLGKFILGFTPTDNYLHTSEQQITVQFRRSLFDDLTLTKNDFLLMGK